MFSSSQHPETGLRRHFAQHSEECTLCFSTTRNNATLFTISNTLCFYCISQMLHTKLIRNRCTEWVHPTVIRAMFWLLSRKNTHHFQPCRNGIFYNIPYCDCESSIHGTLAYYIPYYLLWFPSACHPLHAWSHFSILQDQLAWFRTEKEINILRNKAIY